MEMVDSGDDEDDDEDGDDDDDDNDDDPFATIHNTRPRTQRDDWSRVTPELEI